MPFETSAAPFFLLLPLLQITTLAHHSIPCLPRGHVGCARAVGGKGGEERGPGRWGRWHLQPGLHLRGQPERDTPATHKTVRERNSDIYNYFVTLCSKRFPCYVFIQPGGVSGSLEETRWQRKRQAWMGDCTVALKCLLASIAWEHVLLFRIRGDTVAGAESNFCCIYTTDCWPVGGCLEVWELCALFCKSKRQVGDKQDSLEHFDSVCVSVWIHLCTVLSRLFNHFDLCRHWDIVFSPATCRVLNMQSRWTGRIIIIKKTPAPSSVTDRRTLSRTSSFSRTAETLRRC